MDRTKGKDLTTLTPYWRGFYARIFKRIDSRYQPTRPALEPERLQEYRDGYADALEIERKTPLWDSQTRKENTP